MRAWFVALAATVWAIVVAATVLLIVSIGFCVLPSDPYLRNRFLCSTVGSTGYIDIVTLVVGIPVLILIDHASRNPSWFEKPITTQVMYLWLTLTTIIVLLYLSALLPAGLLSFLQFLLVGVGLAWATLFIVRAETHRVR